MSATRPSVTALKALEPMVESKEDTGCKHRANLRSDHVIET
jgi:hypothetical protein